MSADDWKSCPVCEKYVNEMVKYLYGKVPQEIYEFAVTLKDSLGDSGSWHVSDEISDILLNFETDDELLEKYIDYLSISWDTLNPVRIDYNYHLHPNGTYSFNFSAACNNCGIDFKDEGH